MIKVQGNKTKFQGTYPADGAVAETGAVGSLGPYTTKKEINS